MKTLFIILFIFWSGVSHAVDVNLAWDASPDPITGYTLFYGEQSVLVNPSTPVPVGKALAWTISGLTAGHTYYFAIKAYYYNNESGFSNELIWTAEGGKAPSKVTGLSLSIL